MHAHRQVVTRVQWHVFKARLLNRHEFCMMVRTCKQEHGQPALCGETLKCFCTSRSFGGNLGLTLTEDPFACERCYLNPQVPQVQHVPGATVLSAKSVCACLEQKRWQTCTGDRLHAHTMLDQVLADIIRCSWSNFVLTEDLTLQPSTELGTQLRVRCMDIHHFNNSLHVCRWFLKYEVK